MDYSAFRLDNGSPSGLSFAKNIYNGKKKNIIMYSEGEHCGSIHRDGHWSVAFRVNGVQHRRYCHRIIWELTHGAIDDNLEIDHINGIRSDNRIENMRLVTKKTNLRNQKTNTRNTSGKTGVSLLCVNGYEYWSATWIDDTGKRFAKRFSVSKLSNDIAFERASEYRDKMISEINKVSSDIYTERHCS